MISARTNARWWILLVVAVAQFMLAIDASVVNVMAPRVQESLHLSTPTLQWVMNSYLLLYGGLLLLGGRLSDLLGRRRVFLAGVALFTVASLLAGTSTSAAQLLSMRAVQGAAAAAISPAALAILVTAFTDLKERAKAFGVWGAVIGLGSAVGVLLGGGIANVNWRWAFWVNVPVGLVIVAAALRLVRPDATPATRRPADVAGALTATGGMLALVYGIVTTGTHGWTSPLTIAGYAGGAALLALFVAVEARSEAPLIPLRLLRERTVVAGGLGEFLTAAIMMPIFFLLPLHLQNLNGYTPLGTAVALLPVSAAFVLVPPIASRLIERTGPRALYLVGTAVFALMLVLLARFPLHFDYVTDLLPVAALLGLGIVLCLITTPIVGTSRATEADAGATSAILHAFAQVGAGFGIAVAVTALNSRTNQMLDGGAPAADALHDGIRAGFLVLVVLLVLSVLNGLVGFRGLGRTVAGPPAVPETAAVGTGRAAGSEMDS